MAYHSFVFFMYVLTLLQCGHSSPVFWKKLEAVAAAYPKEVASKDVTAIDNPPGVSVTNVDEDRATEFEFVPAKELFQGDMAGIVEPEETIEHLVARLKNGIGASNRWYAGRVPYTISSSFTSAQRTMIQSAINYISQNTEGTRFVDRTTHSNYVYITNHDTGCYSFVGNTQKGAQYLNLDDSCFKHWIIVHEMMHAIGFEHEQTRSNRDAYVDIFYNNIIKDKQYNYNIVYNTETFGQPYDLKSIMHYQGHEFQLTSARTIRAKSPNQNMALGSEYGFSSTDITKLNKMYPLCAIGYYDVLSGASWTFGKNDEANLSSDSFDKMSSAVVRKGCSFTICKLADFKGGCIKMNGSEPGYHYNFATFTGDWDNQARSYKCQCT